MSILVLTLKQRVGPVLPSLLGELKLTTGELPQSLSLTIKRNWLSPRLPEIRFWMPSAPSHSLHLLSCGDSQLHVFFLAKALQQPPHILCVAMEGLPTGQRWERKGSSTLGLQHDPVLPKDDSPKLKQGMASSGRAERESYALWQLVSYKSSSKLTLHGDKWAWASVELRHKSESKHKQTLDRRHCNVCSIHCPLPDPSRCPSSMSAQNSGCWQFTLLPASLFSSGLSLLFSNYSLTLHSSSLCWLENHLSVTSALLMTRC